MTSMLITRAEINGNQLADVLIEHGQIARIQPHDPAVLETNQRETTQRETKLTVLDAHGGALLPGLHDHHIHFFALLASRRSVACGGLSAELLARELAACPGQGWVRGVDWHESATGVLDRHSLSALYSARPVRLQHSSGKLWVLNDQACLALDLDTYEHPGVERDEHGIATGRVFRLDDWLAARIAERTNAKHDAPADDEVKALVQELYSYGLTGFTDASYTNDVKRVSVLQQLPMRVYCMGDVSLDRGHLKIMLDEDALGDLDAQVAKIQQAHQRSRPVAFHCVSLVELLFLLEAMEVAGSINGDRIEHGGVVPDYCLPRIAKLSLSVVTQPGFLADRGDRFLAQLDAAEHADLYPYQRFLDAGIKVCASSDAPYGPVNPWAVISAAHKRETASGVVINAAECVSPTRALQGYLAAIDDPGGDARVLEVGAKADLCLLKHGCMATLASSESQPVAHTLFNGELVYSA